LSAEVQSKCQTSGYFVSDVPRPFGHSEIKVAVG
jgi:hypothetical protein